MELCLDLQIEAKKTSKFKDSQSCVFGHFLGSVPSYPIAVPWAMIGRTPAIHAVVGTPTTDPQTHGPADAQMRRQREYCRNKGDIR